MILAAYIRRSTADQEQSADTQRRHIADYCQCAGHSLIRVYEEEAISAAVPVEQRPVASELFALAISKRRDFDGVVVVRLDRLFRDLSDQLLWLTILKRHDCQLHTISGPVDTSTPESEFMTTVLGAASQLERKLCGRRIREHNSSLAMQGKVPGGYMPLGLRYDPVTKTVTPTDRAPDVIRIYEECVRAGGVICRTVEAVNRSGILSAGGKPFSNRALALILRNPIYRQRIGYAGRETPAPDLLPRIVPADLTETVDALLAITRTHGSRSKGSRRPYAGFLRCSECGRKLNTTLGTRSRYGAAPVYYGYTCYGKASLRLCESRKVSERILDGLIGQAVATALQGLSDGILGGEPTHPRPDPRVSRIARLEGERARWARMFAEGLLTWDQVQGEVKRIDKQIAELRRDKSPPRQPSPEFMQIALEYPGTDWSKVPNDERRELLALLGAEITVGTARDKPVWVELVTAFDVAPIRTSLRQRSRKHAG